MPQSSNHDIPRRGEPFYIKIVVPEAQDSLESTYKHDHFDIAEDDARASWIHHTIGRMLPTRHSLNRSIHWSLDSLHGHQNLSSFLESLRVFIPCADRKPLWMNIWRSAQSANDRSSPLTTIRFHIRIANFINLLGFPRLQCLDLKARGVPPTSP